jgi:transcriptional regulator with XRE-family HTH domain
MASELWQRIRAIRKHLGITQEAFGAELGVSKAAVSQWESENEETRTTPELPKQVAIAKLVNAPLGWLISDDSELDREWWDFEQNETTDHPVRAHLSKPMSVPEILAALAPLLKALDADGRQSAATLLASWALDPETKKSNARLLEHLLGPMTPDAEVANHIKPAPVHRPAEADKRSKPK